jgi:hypothetical protein
MLLLERLHEQSKLFRIHFEESTESLAIDGMGQAFSSFPTPDGHHIDLDVLGNIIARPASPFPLLT